MMSNKALLVEAVAATTAHQTATTMATTNTTKTEMTNNNKGNYLEQALFSRSSDGNRHGDNQPTKMEMTNNKGNYLEQAHLLQPPTPNSAFDGEDKGSNFWEAHPSLIQHAWSQWEHEYHHGNNIVVEGDDNQQQHSSL